MKVVHICTTLEGGAGLCANRIMSATRALGVDARAIVACGEKTEFVDVIRPVDPYSHFWLIRYFQIVLNIKKIWPKATRVAKRIEAEKRKNPFPVVYTSPITLYKNIGTHPWIREADIVHLHWVGNFMDYESFFKNIDKPIVWTLHDHNPGFGGFHYQFWYDRASRSFITLDHKLALLKERAYQGIKSMTLVAISSKMKLFFEENILLSKFPNVLIYNGIDPKRFSIISKECARKALDLSFDSKVFLFVAQYLCQDIKGLKVLIEALEILNIPNTILVCVGRYNMIPQGSFEIRCEGFVENSRLQSLYYSAADYFVMPSFQESFGQTPLEAMACGTPVVSFPCGISPELINNNNGIVCSDFTSDDLAKGIKLAMSRHYNRDVIREDVISRFSYNKIAKQYVELYEDLHHNCQL